MKSTKTERVWLFIFAAWAVFLMAFFIVKSNASAQILDPQIAQQAYTTGDPNNPDRLGIATQDGRFSVSPQENCENIGIGQNILIYPAFQLPPWLTVSTLDDSSADRCIVYIYGRMSNTPCFTDDSGTCDVAGDLPGPTE
jgi:hypothetical protein